MTEEEKKAWECWNAFVKALGELEKEEPGKAGSVMSDVSWFATDWWGSRGGEDE